MASRWIADIAGAILALIDAEMARSPSPLDRLADAASSPMPQHPVHQLPANPAEGEHTPRNPNDDRDVRRGRPD